MYVNKMIMLFSLNLPNPVSWLCECMLSPSCCVWLFVTPWTTAYQTPLSMGILQARILKWVDMPSSRSSSQPRDQTQVSYISCVGRLVLYQHCHLGSSVSQLHSIKKRKINWHIKTWGSIFNFKLFVLQKIMKIMK